MGPSARYLLFLCMAKLFLAAAGTSCFWYAVCHHDPNDANKNYNCVYNGEPKPLEGEYVTKLNDLCPHLNATGVCCDGEQVDNLDGKLKLAVAMLNRCPTCLRNLQRHYCDFTCSPDQKEFLHADKLALNENGQEYIEELGLYVSPDYMQGTYNSCMGVVMPSSANLALDVMCGIYGAKECNYQRWFSYMSDIKTPFVPFQMNYYEEVPEDSNATLLNPPILPCSEAYEGSRSCSCMDCQLTCPIISVDDSDDDFVEEEFLIAEMDGILFIMLIVYAVLAIIFTGLIIILGGLKKQPLKGTKKKQKPTCLAAKPGEYFNRCLEKFFTKWGTVFASHPVLVLCASSWIVAGMAYGALDLKVTTEPVEIWAAPQSQSRIEKDYFDSRFDPFYRTEQIFFKAVDLPNINYNGSGGEIEFGPVFHKDFLLAILDLQEQIFEIGRGTDYELRHICFSPLVNEGNEVFDEDCAVQSVWGYLANNRSTVENCTINEGDPSNFDNCTYLDTLRKCLQNSYDVECLAPYKGPVEAAIAVGGFARDGTNKYNLATGLSMTILVRNHLNKTKLEPALKWEKSYIELMKNWTSSQLPLNMSVAFSSERSIEDELERESEAEMITVVISYCVMFVYIAIALGRFSSLDRLLVDSKVILGAGGIIIVLMAVISSLGIFAYAGVATTLLTIEVIPFLVLAVGVDNIFILVQTHQRNRRKKNESHAEHVGRTLGQVGPSILLTSISESCCFFLGAISDMPAVKSFAMYAAVALLLDFLFQITCFISLLALDSKRQEENRLEVCCFLKSSKKPRNKNVESLMYSAFKNFYMPFLLHPIVRIVVVWIFLLGLCTSIVLIPNISIGLDQKLSMPEDSYVLTYFQYMDDLLSMGPPVYFVVKSGLNFSTVEDQNLICGGQGCNNDSISTQLYKASLRPQR